MERKVHNTRGWLLTKLQNLSLLKFQLYGYRSTCPRDDNLLCFYTCTRRWVKHESLVDLNLKNQWKVCPLKQAKRAKPDKRNTITEFDIHHQSLISGINNLGIRTTKCRSPNPLNTQAVSFFQKGQAYFLFEIACMYYDYVKPFGPCINHHSIALNSSMSSRTIILWAQ